MKQLDLIDRKIVAILMADATTPIAQISDRVGLSPTPCWKRIQRLEATGVLTARVTLADPLKLGIGLSVFVSVQAADHGADWRDAFLRLIDTLPQVMEAWRMAGETDYLLRVAVADMAAYDAFYRQLTDAIAIKNVTSSFAMERLRHTTAYPLNTRDR